MGLELNSILNKYVLLVSKSQSELTKQNKETENRKIKCFPIRNHHRFA